MPQNFRQIARINTFVPLAAVVLVAAVQPPTRAQLTAADFDALRARGAAEGWTFTIAENEAAAYPLAQLCGAVEPPDWRAHARFDNSAPRRDLPDAFDWRWYNGLTPVRNQGGCGSCWAFAAIGTVESAVLRIDGLTQNHSEQWLVSCTTAGNCSGGWHTAAYEFLRCGALTDPCGDNGIVMESSFPYVAWNAPCGCPYGHPNCIPSWSAVGPPSGIATVEQIKQAIYDHGPVSTCVYANAAFQGYGGGIFNACEDHDTNHVVVLVGWDDNQGAEGVWILRNSWGSAWGEGGYMRIAYNCSRVGYATCYVDYTPFVDCNSNGIRDALDIFDGTSDDCNFNGVPDECDLAGGASVDCDGNGLLDECEWQDCNTNGVLDLCDLMAGTSQDCDLNGQPDECQDWQDCNGNGVLDTCDIISGASEDCDGNVVPDECEGQDCNGNGVLDICDLGSGTSHDCDWNGVPDECDPWQDCNGNGTYDACDILYATSTDCNWNAIPDECEPMQDCNLNGVFDTCDIFTGTSQDANWNGVPDECEILGDLNCDGSVGFGDINPFVKYASNCAVWQAQYPGCPAENGDIDGDGLHACNGYPFDDINAFVGLLSGK